MSASAHLIACPKCRALLGGDMLNLTELQPCPSCQTPLQVEVFPALFRQEAAARPERIIAEGEAGCFYHPEKKAAVVCDACGRFLCALCDVDFDGQHICPACLESGKEKGKIKKLEQRRLRHDKIALVLAVLPIIIFYLTVITAPIALFYSIKHWNSPASVVPNRPKATLSIAIVLASLQIMGWIVFFIFLVVR
jgi:hypothetical protein